MAEEDELVVEEEFSVWKKNCPFLYDLVVSHPLQWPSLTVHWLPSSSPQPYSHSPSFHLHKLLFATHTSPAVPNFLILADALLPVSTSQPVTLTDPLNPLIPKVCLSTVRSNSSIPPLPFLLINLFFLSFL